MENFSKKLIQYCINKGLSISIAESCTGGMIISKLISIPGASKVIDCGLVTYSNKAKQIYLNVPRFELEKYGAVSKQVAESMINGLKNKNNSDISIFFLLPIFYFLNPFFPSGNFFNNWFMAIGTFSIPFYLYFNAIKKN